LSNDPVAAASTAGPAEVFAHQVRHFGDPDDSTLGLSVDGHCRNVRPRSWLRRAIRAC